MRLEDQVCTLEQSIKLQELGIKAESIFYYAVNGIKEPLLIWGNIDQQGGRYTQWEKHPAYTVAELGEMLPDMAAKDNGLAQIETCRSWTTGEYCCYYENSFGNNIALFESPTEAETRAAMLIHLIENAIPSTSKTTEA